MKTFPFFLNVVVFLDFGIASCIKLGMYYVCISKSISKIYFSGHVNNTEPSNLQVSINSGPHLLKETSGVKMVHKKPGTKLEF